MTNTEVYALVKKELLKREDVATYTGPAGSTLMHFDIGGLSFTPFVHKVGTKQMVEFNVVRAVGDRFQRIEQVDLDFSDIVAGIAALNEIVDKHIG